ncbi:conserved hypothetical protein [Histoplasma mississippiense (nom. inval.)]|uniref:conserved hypothetical protein n=1 Tax=Ajellomyces capsulatus (strain NAm1 / WU24) TaxID=2059318 RepID=UPI000157B365|nr:conserved hypothetical protein [Histoplasma mississippiense (nom. inval.)]EDN02715.1 conserved hypothetical protein [Histoplasma mississippiense (nom. inval.)]
MTRCPQPRPGTWRHPQLKEIVRRQNASTFGDRNVKKIALNGGSMLNIPTYPDLVLLAIRLLLLLNIVVALYPLYRPKDDLSDIPLTPSQRSLLGLDPSHSAPATPGSKYVTPPRYRLSSGSRTASPISPSSSPLSGRSGSQSTGKSQDGFPYSPSPSPLFHKAMGNGTKESRSAPCPRSVDSLGTLSNKHPRPRHETLVDTNLILQAFVPPSTPVCRAGNHLLAAFLSLQFREVMGGSESKLAFRQGIFRLSEESNIAADDPYWTGFWELPESPEDVFSLFSPADIRRTRDASIANLETLILAVTSRLIVLKNHPSFPDPDLAPDRDALNCIRVLTRILPFIYESENLEAWEEKFFWGRRRKKHRHAQIASQVLFDGASEDDEMRRSNPQDHQNDYDAKPLAEELIDTLVDLLFYSGFTIPTIPNAKGKVSYSIWQSGVGCTTAMGSNKELESNRSNLCICL